MNFLTPLFLIGTLAVVGPLLVHLVRRQQTDRVRFSSLMFLREMQAKVIRRQTIRHWVLLMVRCLAVIVLVLAFSRPYFPNFTTADVGGQQRYVAVLVDSSFSMRSGGRWQQAVERAVEIVSSTREQDRLAVIAFSTGAEILNEPAESRSQVAAKIRSLKPAFRSTQAEQALKVAAQWMGPSPPKGSVVYLVSDFQKSGAFDRRVPFAPAVRVEPVAVGNDPRNLWIQDVVVARNLYGAGKTEKPVVIIRNELGHAVEAVVRLLVEGKPAQQKSASLPDDSNQSVTLDPLELPPGVARCEAVIEPSDDLPEDNRFYFTLRRVEPRKVLVLYSADASKTLYLERAVVSETNSPFSVKVQPASAWDAADSADFVVLYQVPMTEATARKLGRFVEQGKSVLWLPASESMRAHQDLLPASTEEKTILRRERDKFLTLSEADWDHPVFSTFRDLRNRYFGGIEFYGYIPARPSAGSRVLARFSNGSPALVEKPVGSGRILMFASGLDRDWTDLPLTSAFVPLVHRILAVSLNLTAERTAYRVEEMMALRNLSIAQSAGDADSGWTILDPTGNRVTGVESDAEPEYLNLEQPGFYELRWKRRTDYQAANTVAQESDLDTVDPAVVTEESNGSPSPFRSLGPAALSAEEAEQRQSPWRWLILMVGVLLLLEMALAHRASTHRKG